MAGWRAYSFECFAIHSALIFLCAIFSFLQESRAFSATMQIFVVVPDGSSSVVEIAGDATVGALKHAIEDVQFVPADQQQIAFSEEVLDEDDECLEFSHSPMPNVSTTKPRRLTRISSTDACLAWRGAMLTRALPCVSRVSLVVTLSTKESRAGVFLR